MWGVYTYICISEEVYPVYTIGISDIPWYIPEKRTKSPFQVDQKHTLGDPFLLFLPVSATGAIYCGFAPQNSLIHCYYCQ